MVKNREKIRTERKYGKKTRFKRRKMKNEVVFSSSHDFSEKYVFRFPHIIQTCRTWYLKIKLSPFHIFFWNNHFQRRARYARTWNNGQNGDLKNSTTIFFSAPLLRVITKHLRRCSAPLYNPTSTPFFGIEKFLLLIPT